MLKKYIHFLSSYKWFIAVGIPIVILILSLSLLNAKIDGSFKIWFGKESKIIKDYNNFKDTFSNDDAITIVFKDENTIFNQKALHSIESLNNAFMELDYVVKVTSILNYQHIHSTLEKPDDVLVDDFIGNISTLTKKDLDNKKREALNNKSMVKLLISEDATTTIVIARLDSNDDVERSEQIMSDVYKIIEKETKKTGYKYYINGGPALVQAFIQIAKAESMVFTPLVFLLSLLLLILLFRRISGALIPFLVVFLTSLAVLSIQVLLGYKLNIFTINIPIFIVAIGIADAIHIYGIWLKQKSKGFSTKESVSHSLEKNFLAILFTSLTTSVGFASLGFSSVVPIATLGIAISSASILAFIISILWLPSLLLLIEKDIILINPKKESKKLKWNYGAFIIKNNKKIIALSIFLMSILFIGLFKLEVDTNIIRHFDKKIPIRQSAEFIMDNLTGAVSYEMIIDSGKKDGIKEPEFLATVEKFSDDFKEKFPKDIRYIKSLTDVIRSYNKIINYTDTLPKSRELIAQYLLLYSISIKEPSDLTDFMDFNEQKLRVIAVVNLVNTSVDVEMLNYAREWWKKTNYSLLLTGKTVMNADLQVEIAKTIIISLTITLIVVSLMMFLIFKRGKILWILILPNLLPVVLVLGFMGWIGINIDMGVAITGAIIIGVAVDDTIHFLFKYFDARKKDISLEEVFNEVLSYAGKAIIFTTLVLSISFSVIIFSNFLPNKHFGIITTIALSIAMILDMFLLPALLSIFDKKKN